MKKFNKNFKVLLKAFSAMVVLTTILFSTTGCFGSVTPNDSDFNEITPPNNNENNDNSDYIPGYGKSMIELSNVDYGFIKADLITDDEEITIDKCNKPTNFNVIDNYYFVISFQLTSRNNNSGTDLINTNISFGNAEFLDGNIYTNSSGSETKRSLEKDSTNANQILHISTSSLVPSLKDQTTKIRIVVKMTTLKVGESSLSCNFTSDSSIIVGENGGFTKLVVIDRVKIEDPVIEFDENSLQLKFTNVKHADYYKIYVDGVLQDDEHVYNVDEFTSVGGELSWDISTFVTGSHRIKIQAFSNSTNFLISNYSNEVDVII